MVVQFNVKRIVTLLPSNVIGGGRSSSANYGKDCCQFFPCAETNQKISLEGIYVRNVEQYEDSSSRNYIYRRFKIERKHDKKVIHQLEHYHFLSWGADANPKSDVLPDLCSVVKNCAQFVQGAFESLQENYQLGKKNPAKLLVHCKEGTGRTGTMIALINLYI